jgi:hypothetical protein
MRSFSSTSEVVLMLAVVLSVFMWRFYTVSQKNRATGMDFTAITVYASKKQ